MRIRARFMTVMAFLVGYRQGDPIGVRMGVQIFVRATVVFWAVGVLLLALIFHVA